MIKKEKYKKWESMNRILSGIFLMIFILGSSYSIELVKYSFWIMIGLAFILYFYFTTVFLAWFIEDKVGKKTQIFGFVGVVLLSLFLGIQSPQVPFKIWIFMASIFILLIGLIKYSRLKVNTV